MVKPWTREDLIYLKRNYNIVPVEEIAEKLGRTKEAIYNKVSYMRRRRWSFS
jgi:biotin operon repressor